MAKIISYTKTLAAASANNIAQAQVAVAGTPLTLNGSAVTAGVATIDTYNATNNTAPGRIVLLTSTSAVETASVTITGTNAAGQQQTEVVTFSGASTTASSVLNYVTVTKLVPSGTIVGNLSAGTSAVGSASWSSLNWQGDSPMNVSISIELVSGAATFTVDYTYDDPNSLPPGVTTPLAFTATAFTGGKSATTDGAITTPVTAVRASISTGTGTIRARFLQAGIG